MRHFRAISAAFAGIAFAVMSMCGQAAAGVLRERCVTAVGAPRPVPGEVLSLPAFDGAGINVVVGRRSVSSAGLVSYSGRTAGSSFLNTSIVMVKDGFVATVTDVVPGRNLVASLRGGEWRVQEVARSHGGVCGAPKRAPASRSAAGLRKMSKVSGDPLIDGRSFLRRGELATNVVDVLVGLDRSAADWIREKSAFAGMDGATELFAKDLIERSNNTCANTGLDRFFRFNLAGVVEIGLDCSALRYWYYDESFIDTEAVLDYVSGYRTAPREHVAEYNKVREAREATCADIVTFLVSCGQETAYGVVGQGFALDDSQITDVTFSDYAYNICIIEAAAYDTTVVHEIGHNMGAGHADMKDAESSGPQLYGYSSGYYFNVTNAEGNVFMHGATAMAYSYDGYSDDYERAGRWGEAPEYADDPAAWENGYFSETPFFSSPNHTYKYITAVGDGEVEVDSGVPLGDETHDNTRLLSKVYPVVANYRVRKCTVALVDPEGGAKSLAGGGMFGPGSTTTLKATPAANRIFAGWYEAYEEREGFSSPVAAVDGADYRNATLKTAIGSDEVARAATREIYARFVSAEEDAAGLVLDLSDCTTAQDGTCSIDLGRCVESPSLPKLSVSGLPSGLKFDSKTRSITGKATKPGVYTVTVSATNTTVKKAVTGTFLLTVPNFTCDALPNLRPAVDAYGAFQTGVSFPAAAVDCTASSAGWKVSASGLPSGLKYNASTGAISGVPTKTGSYTVTFTATRGSERQVATVTLKIIAPPEGAVGVFNGFVKADSTGADAENLGTLQFTATETGRLSAKVTTADGAVSFSGTGWEEADGGLCRAALSTKKGELLNIVVDAAAAWNAVQLTGEFTPAGGSRGYEVVAQRNAFANKMWHFAATVADGGGWTLSFAQDAKSADISVTLKADGSTSVAGKLGAISVSAAGFADVSALSSGVIYAGFAPVVSVKEGTKTVKRTLSLKLNLWFDRSNDHQNGVGSACLMQ